MSLYYYRMGDTTVNKVMMCRDFQKVTLKPKIVVKEEKTYKIPLKLSVQNKKIEKKY